MRSELEVGLLAMWFLDDKKEFIQDADMKEDFFEDKKLFKIVKAYKDAGYPFDIALASHIIGEAETARIVSRYSRIGTLANARFYINELKRLSALDGIYADIGNNKISSESLKEYAAQINNEVEEKPIFNFNSTADYTNEIERRIKKEDKRYDFGFHYLDKTLGKLTPGYFIVIGGLPGTGKTNISLKILDYSVNKNIPCLYMSSEMSGISLLDRIISFNAREVGAYKIRNGDLESADVKKINRVLETRVYGKPCSIIESGSFNIEKIERYVNEIKPAFVFVDYLQMFYLEFGSGENRASAMSEIARQLKELAVDKGVIVVALSQVNADNQMKESRGIEEKADVVIKLEEKGNFIDYKDIDIFVSKNRFGNTNTHKFRFDKFNCDFTEA